MACSRLHVLSIKDKVSCSRIQLSLKPATLSTEVEHSNTKSLRSSTYCIFGNFRENFIFANSIKRHICDSFNSRISHDLPISVNDSVILPSHENKTLAKISEFTVPLSLTYRKSTWPLDGLKMSRFSRAFR